VHRIEVRLKSHLPDARGKGLVKDIRDLGIHTVSSVRVTDVYWLDADLEPEDLELVCQLLADPVTQDYRTVKTISTEEEVTARHHVVEVTYNPGVVDPVRDCHESGP